MRFWKLFASLVQNPTLVLVYVSYVISNILRTSWFLQSILMLRPRTSELQVTRYAVFREGLKEAFSSSQVSWPDICRISPYRLSIQSINRQLTVIQEGGAKYIASLICGEGKSDRQVPDRALVVL